MRIQTAILPILVLAWVPYVTASAGDVLPEFRACVLKCIHTTCVYGPELPLHLRAMFWDCSQNCDYNCQRSITADRIAVDKPVLQFHGKWPFKRVFGIQELASVLFSMANFVPHYLMFKKRHELPDDDTRANLFLKKYCVLVTIVGMNAWVWSSVFHCRDFKLTERLDYFSAGLTVMTGFYFAVVRVFRLDRMGYGKIRRVFTLLCVAALLAHISYLSFIHFSYSYNMLANVVIGILQNTIWIWFSITQYLKTKESYNLWPLWNVLLLSAGMSLELLDFPPLWDAVDAHSLWHAATVGPSVWWYCWMQLDLTVLARSKKARD
ncbi:Per1-like protein [Lipomyces arxii]|uniref:Per1-like protein n=1 Tax=Lipomyces arxii TaxID=56418 RepID=UPI0034CFBC41